MSFLEITNSFLYDIGSFVVFTVLIQLAAGVGHIVVNTEVQPRSH